MIQELHQQFQPLIDKHPINLTEIPQVGSIEIWEIVNLNPDAHPIHIH